MEDKKTQDFIRTLEAAKLPASSRVRMREELAAYADYHPAPGETASPEVQNDAVRMGADDRFIKERGGQKGAPAPLFASHMKPMALIASILIALTLGGTSYAAEQATPGDTLYPVKTEINERILAAFTFSAEGEANLAARLAERRLAEAEQLIAESRFDAEARASVEAHLDEHAEAAAEAADELAERGDHAAAAEARARLAGALEAHAGVIGALTVERGTDETRTFLSDLRARVGAAVSAEATVEANYTADTARAAVARAEVAVREARAAFEDAELRAEVRARVELRLQAAEAALVEARAQLEAEAYAAAHRAVHTAVRIAAEVESVIAAMSRIDFSLDLRGTVDADTNTTDRPETPENDETTESDDGRGGLDVEIDTNAGTSTGGGVNGSINIDGTVNIR